jgi:hypothetical protein
MRAAALALLAGCGGGPPSPPVFVVQHDAVAPDLGAVLRAERETAAASGRCTVAQVYADWCGPCKELRASMDDARMQDAFRGVHLVRLELGAWDAQLRAQREEINLPTLYIVEPDGKLGRSIDGSAWGPNTPENMASPLSAFFDDVCGPRAPRG